MRALLIVGLAALTGCAGVQFLPLNEAEASVRMLESTEPPLDCKELGEVHAVWELGYSLKETQLLLKRLTLYKGGNVVQYKGSGSSRGTLSPNDQYGVAFDCPQARR